MTILAIVNNYPPVIDGIGDFTFNLVSELGKRGCTAFVFCRKNEQTAIDNNISSCKYLVPNWGHNSLPYLKQTVQKLQPDIVFLQYVPYAFSSKGIAFWWLKFFNWCKREDIRTAIFFHEVAIDPYQHRSIKEWLLGTGQRWIARKMAALADHCFTSTLIYSQLLGGTAVNIVPIPSNFEYLVTKDLLEKTRVKRDNLDIVSFSNRCTETLLDAFMILEKLFPGTCLHLIGKTEEARVQWIEQYCSKKNILSRVVIYKELESNQMLRVMKNASIYIQLEPVNHLRQGGISAKSGALATALMLGLPVITTKGNLSDDRYFRHADTLFFTSAGNAAAVATDIQHLLQETSLMDKLSRHAMQLYKDHFSWNRAADRFMDVFETNQNNYAKG